MGSFKKEANRRVRDGTNKGGDNFKVKGYVLLVWRILPLVVGHACLT